MLLHFFNKFNKNTVTNDNLLDPEKSTNQMSFFVVPFIKTHLNLKLNIKTLFTNNQFEIIVTGKLNIFLANYDSNAAKINIITCLNFKVKCSDEFQQRELSSQRNFIWI